MNLDDPEVAAGLLVDAAQRNEAIVSVTELPDSPNWLVEFESGECLATLAGSPSRMVLTGAIGRPAAAERADMQDAALAYNLLWDQTCGMRVALDSGQNDLLLVQELYADALASAELSDVLMRFEVMRMWWSVVIHTAHGTPEREQLRQDLIGLLA